MMEYASCMNIYLNTYKMITTKLREKTLAPTAPITTSRCRPAVCDSKSTKSKLIYIKQNQEGTDDRIKNRGFFIS